MEEKHVDIIATKFCNIAAPPEQHDACLSKITEAITSGTPDFSALVEITGKSEDELIKILTKSCPLCPTAETG
jgi:hypothetical protein